jgi:hypothetical protein
LYPLFGTSQTAARGTERRSNGSFVIRSVENSCVSPP